MLQLPSAWSNFISKNTHGTSCLRQLSGLEGRKEIYKKAVSTLSDGRLTTLILVSRPDNSPQKEAERAWAELREIDVNNQVLVLNGVLEDFDDDVPKAFIKNSKRLLHKHPRH